jgi:hypothetical protein
MAVRARFRNLYRSLREIRNVTETWEACSPLNMAMTACRRQSSFERTWYDGVVMAIARPSENV